jgi:outer membrane scaffolding protein for murein synthesis (MipA/OmpV family)
MKIRRGIVVALLILGFLFPGRAVCEEKPVFELGIGAALLYLPHYRGSDQSRGFLLPYPYVIYRGDIIKVDKEKVSGQIFKTDRILLDISIYGSVPVKSDNCSARAGMPDLDPTFEIGPALDISILESRENRYSLKFVLPVRAVFATNFSYVSHEGWVFAPRLNFEKYDIIPQTGLELGISAGLMFADSGYHDYYYTVDPAYATATRPAYSAGGGYSGSTLTVGLSKTYKQFFFSAFVSADFLQGTTFADSPLVKTNTSIMSGCTVSWVFFKSSKTVATDK